METMTEDVMDWGDEKVSDVTLKELTGLCNDVRKLRDDKKLADDMLKVINGKIATKEAKVLEYLSEYGMKNFSGDFGMVVRTKRYSVKQPDGPEKKSEFFNWLREKGVFEEMVSVNSRTLTSFVKAEHEATGKTPPGLLPPEIVETISLRKA